MSDAVVTVRGIKELRRALRQLEDAARKDMQGELKGEFKRAASVVADAGRRQAPARTGRLAKSISPRGAMKGAKVVANARYGWYVHQGRTNRGVMTPNPFLARAATAKASEVREILAEGLGRVVDRVMP